MSFGVSGTRGLGDTVLGYGMQHIWSHQKKSKTDKNPLRFLRMVLE